MWAQKEAAVGQASARGRAMFVVPGSNVKHNDFLMLITFQMYRTWLWNILSLLPALTTNEPTNIYWATTLNKALHSPAFGIDKVPRELGFVRVQSNEALS